MKTTCLVLLLAALAAGAAGAQTAAELVTATAISSTLDKSLTIRLPSGTSFVRNPTYAASLAPTLLGADAPRYADFQLYVARGLATRLMDAYLMNLKTQYAASGFMTQGSRSVTAGKETWTRTDLVNPAGRTVAILTAKRTDGVYIFTSVMK